MGMIREAWACACSLWQVGVPTQGFHEPSHHQQCGLPRRLHARVRSAICFTEPRFFSMQVCQCKSSNIHISGHLGLRHIELFLDQAGEATLHLRPD